MSNHATDPHPEGFQRKPTLAIVVAVLILLLIGLFLLLRPGGANTGKSGGQNSKPTAPVTDH